MNDAKKQYLIGHSRGVRIGRAWQRSAIRSRMFFALVLGVMAGSLGEPERWGWWVLVFVPIFWWAQYKLNHLPYRRG